MNFVNKNGTNRFVDGLTNNVSVWDKAKEKNESGTERRGNDNKMMY